MYVFEPVPKNKIARGSKLFMCMGNRGDLQHDKLAEDCIGFMNETLASVLAGKNLYENSFLCHVRDV